MPWIAHVIYGLLYVLIPALLISLVLYSRYMRLYEKSIIHREKDIEPSDLVQVDIVKIERDPVLKKKSMAAKTVSTALFAVIGILFTICLIFKFY